MTWPTGQEYSEFIQSPSSAFDDRELKTGSIEVDRLGLPRPRSGNFAVVYRVECRARAYAVKCFTREVVDQQRRYAGISEHLSAINCPYMVAFDYLNRGIRVKGKWYPVLRMEWISGEPLLGYIERSLPDRASIQRLAGRWIQMVRGLRSMGIAHGDLQHGNVIVVDGLLKLVDYDGMFVPTLAGFPAAESGHPNYQHPRRATQVFGPRIDNYSAWCVYVSLVALSVDPSLWTRLSAGDDCLLFRAGDLADPSQSAVFRTLARSVDDGVSLLAELFAQLTQLSPDQVPPLDEPKFAKAQLGAVQRSTAAWFNDHLRPHNVGAITSAQQSQSQDGEVDASWILKLGVPPAPPRDSRFVSKTYLTRPFSWLSILLLTVGAGTGATIAIWIGLILLGFTVLLILNAYGTEAGPMSRKAALKASSTTNARLVVFRTQKVALDERVQSLIAQRKREVASAEIKSRTVGEKARSEIENVKRRFMIQTAETQRRRSQIENDYRAALSKVVQTTGARVRELDSQRTALIQQETTEIKDSLEAMQGAYRKQVLQAANISTAHIQGFGPKLKSALVSKGIASAHGIERWRLFLIPGFGPTRVEAVMAWVNSVEQYVQATMPQYLPSLHEQAIRAKYKTQSSTLSSDLRRFQSQQQREEGELGLKISGQLHEIDAIEAGPRAAANGEIQAIQSRCDTAIGVLQRNAESAKSRAAMDVEGAEKDATALKRSYLALRVERFQALMLVKSYRNTTLGKFLAYNVFGTR